ncbi:mucin-2-like isoform X2 [Ostrea edulis]|uniref:mucin-2-like isoform X2 n=1 Tax=Ostrea edulis TaxID=37623 RepID=UPI0024AFECC5|nr:mucin-2-like isoform X2 [Ostrea edulis]
MAQIFQGYDDYKYYKADAQLTLQGTYSNDLGDSDSNTYIDFRKDFCKLMESNQGQHTEAYKGCIVTNIRNGSIIVYFTMFYYTKAIMQTTEVRIEIMAKMKDSSTSITLAVTFTVVIQIDTLHLNVLRTNEAEYLSSERDPHFFNSSVAIATEESTTPIDISTTAEITTTDSPVTTTATADSPLTITTYDEQLTSTTTHSASTQSLETTTTTILPETTTTTIPSETTTTTIPSETTTTTILPKTTTTTIPSETTTTTNTPETTTTTNTPETTTTTIPSETTTTTILPETTTTTIPSETSTTTILPETTNTTIPLETTTTTIPPETTTTTNLPETTTTTNLPETTTTTTNPPETTTTTIPPENTTTNLPETTTATIPLETTTTAITPETTTTTNLPETNTTTNPPETTTITITPETTTNTILPEILTTTNLPETTTTTNTPETITTTNTPETTTTTNFPETTTTTDLPDITTTTELPSFQLFAEIKMDHAYGEIGQVSNQTCMIEIKEGDWEFVSLKFKESNEDLAVVQSNGSVTIYTTDSLLRPEFNISESTIKAIVNFDLTNFTSDRCSSRQYTLLCSVNMRNGYIFNTSGDFDIIAPLTEPEVTVVETMYNRSLSAAGINAMCNLTKDQSNKTAQALGIQILNSTGDVILTNVDVTPYNVSTSSCGELVYISWIELFKYRADLNMSTLNCFLENSVSKKTVFSNNITLIFKDQQQP